MPPSPTAIRSRRYRQRHRHGLMIVPVEVDQDVIDALVEYAFLDETDRCKRAKVADAKRGGLGHFEFVPDVVEK